MAKQKNIITEFRNYPLRVEFPILLLTGNQWWISDVPSANLHFHNCLEIGLCHEGEGTLIIQKERRHFSAGDITIIARNIPHTTYSAPGTRSLWTYLFVDPQELLGPLTEGYAQKMSELLRKLNTAFLIPAGHSPSVSFYFNQICHALQEKPANHHLKVCSDFLSMVIDVVNFLPKSTSIAETIENTSTLSIVPALRYINQHYMTSFSMDYLAELCGLSPTHFRRIFNLAMERSPLEYLNTVRINKACYLLRSTENSILNISEDVGFHSISSFNRYFSRMIGMSPREYRCCDSQDERLQKSKIMKFNGWMEAER